MNLASQAASQPRTRCRLHCTITQGRKRIHARVLDVSEGGLCIVTPVRFEHRSTVEIVIDVPRCGPVAVEGVAWHERPFRQPSSRRRGWATGFVLAKAEPAFHALAKPNSTLPKAAENPLQGVRGKRSALAESHALAQAIETDGTHQLFRVRLKALGSPRTRALTLSAISEKAVREAVLADLSGQWEIIGVEQNPLD